MSTEINIEAVDRGTETAEELEARMSPEAIAMAVNNADAVVKRKAQESRGFNSRNRDAWKRMNRPEKLAKIEANMERILNFCNFKGYILDADVPKEPKETAETAETEETAETADA